MTQLTPISTGLHAAAIMYAEEHKAGKLSRREFLTRTTALACLPQAPMACWA